MTSSGMNLGSIISHEYIVRVPTYVNIDIGAQWTMAALFSRSQEIRTTVAASSHHP